MRTNNNYLEKNPWFQSDIPLSVEPTQSKGITKLLSVDLFKIDRWGDVCYTVTSSSDGSYYGEETGSVVTQTLRQIDSIISSHNVFDIKQVKREKNMELLRNIREAQNIGDEDYVSEKVIDNALLIVFDLSDQPSIFKTSRNSIHMQFEKEDRSYLEFEVFENRVTCMMVPKRDYSQAEFPDVSLDNRTKIIRIVGDFYGTT